MSHPHHERMIVALLSRPYHHLLAYLSTRLRAEFPDLQASHFIVIQVIDHPPAGSRLTWLAEQARMTKQSMGQLVDALERTGYVERIADPTDRRAKQIRLTERGWTAHERGGAIVRQAQEEWAGRLGEAKFAHLLALLRELGEHLEPG